MNGEGFRGIVSLVKGRMTKFEVMEMLAEKTSDKEAHKTARQMSLRDTSQEDVDVAGTILETREAKWTLTPYQIKISVVLHGLRFLAAREPNI